MARTTGSDGEKTEAAIREAALELIARLGFEAMSMRQLAASVGVQPAALYRYFTTKEALLHALMLEHMERLIASWGEARPAHGSDKEKPAGRLAKFVENHIRFHLARRNATHVSNLELRSLSSERLEQILALRSQYEGELRSILTDGQREGVFQIDDVALTAMAIIQMITGVIVWFRPELRLSEDEVAANYHTMTMRLVGAEA
ncbi:TetR family transcriptional regulator [Nitratireductor aquimarinus]|uniref:TetR/AcrR family transcriptional regulator n=1 Tax=Nitratireductor aquimarinus TaxID=889300 RepID=UPI001A8F7D24|nr:TetR/AcrR family transcriptional regulator [Nitratireductor aquimarinus]MBN8241933.1 TetR family transcriptional regulator [Nitratireductor aquimarinus]MBY6130319.1 TetR/AcrR family transcriptional regulator [Nitratireductor aquimarinus]MCA1302929.1 TetR/AcrR family transcriptional regulator [Nitratireductor aquimarinus]